MVIIEPFRKIDKWNIYTRKQADIPNGLGKLPCRIQKSPEVNCDIDENGNVFLDGDEIFHPFLRMSIWLNKNVCVMDEIIGLIEMSLEGGYENPDSPYYGM